MDVFTYPPSRGEVKDVLRAYIKIFKCEWRLSDVVPWLERRLHGSSDITSTNCAWPQQ